MKWYTLFGVGLITLVLTACGSHPATAADRPNLLIMGEDADPDSVPRDSRVFRRVVNALSNQLHDEGFAVYDETAITLDNFAQGRVRRTDAELIDIGRSISQPPIDVLVLFTIYASAQDVQYTTKVRTRVEGRLLNVRTGQRLGNFELPSPREWNAPPDCSRECILEIVGEHARILANDVGSVLTEKLAWMVDGGSSGGADSSNGGSQLPNAYALVFDGFTPEEMMVFEEYLVIFSGYKSHRPTYSGARRQEIWYESSINDAKLNRNMQRMLQETNLRGVVTFSGNTFTVRKITLRDDRKPAASDGW